jgi:hypothetical protein
MPKPIEQAQSRGEIAGAYLAAGDVENSDALSKQYIDEISKHSKNQKDYVKQLQAYYEGMHKSDPDDVHLWKDEKGNLKGIFCDYSAASLAKRAQAALERSTPANLVAQALNGSLANEQPEGRRNTIMQDTVKDFNRRAEQAHQAHNGSGRVEYRASINKQGKIEVNPLYFT